MKDIRNHLNSADAIKPTDRQPSARLIAYYLPQFHPIAENDQWWGKGFTEWANVTKSKPLFPGHHQPNLPADLGFYDLRVPESREQQAELASQYGIEGFCYWHYWFGNGRRLLERPFNDVLKTGRPAFPFCLAWANEAWAGVHYDGERNRVLIDQTYPGTDDYKLHYRAIEEAFFDKRYIKVDGKPLFVVYKPQNLPEPSKFVHCWRELAQQSGLPGLHLVGVSDCDWDPHSDGFDATIPHEPWHTLAVMRKSPIDRAMLRYMNRDLSDLGRKLFGMPRIVAYEDFVEASFSQPMRPLQYPCVVPNWDTTPRLGKHAVVMQGSRPELFSLHLNKALKQLSGRTQEHRIVFVKSWNEWAEGNYIEPDRRFAHGYLEAIREAVLS